MGDLAKIIIDTLINRRSYIVTVESCTGGALVNALTDVPGAGDVLKDSFVVYSNEAKRALDVPQEIFDKHTVYSAEMALALARAGAKVSVAKPLVAVGITGTLSRTDPNDENTPHSKLGDVYIAAVQGDEPLFAEALHVPPHLLRPEAKRFVVRAVLERLLAALG